MARHGTTTRSQSLSRRQFLTRSVVGATALAVAGQSHIFPVEARALAAAELTADVVIVGGGVGGVSAALAALKLGRRVILSEEGDWLGGQLTAQAVPPDENPWIETFGGTASYRRLREGIRDYYRQHYPLRLGARANQFLNPGLGGVSAICHEPHASLAVIEETLAPYRANGQLTVLMGHRPTGVTRAGNRVVAVTMIDGATGASRVLQAPFILDATELGDLLEMALPTSEYVIGAESQAETGELHALAQANPLDQQAVSWCFPLDYLPGEDHTIPKPPEYDFWRSYRPTFQDGRHPWPNELLNWTDVHPVTMQPRYRPLFDNTPEGQVGANLWHFRRIFYHHHALFGLYPSDITLVNWPQIDYWLKPLVGVSEAEKGAALRGARGLSLSWIYWMQTEAPRHDGGYGYQGLRLRPDVTGTDDGLAKAVYVRESRRIKAVFTVKEQHIGAEARAPQQGAAQFPDSVGIGSYRIDLHPTPVRNYVDVASFPFQIPLGALIPRTVENLLPAAKNIGTTHITNGCYRLHPVEWNIGEAAGALAAFCLDRPGTTPRQVRADAGLLAGFQRVLTDVLGVPRAWPEGLRTRQSDGPLGG